MIVSQLTDNKALFLRDRYQIPTATEKKSGLFLNCNKSELYPTHDCPLKDVSGIKYIGLYLTNDYEVCQTPNVKNKLKKYKSKLNERL